MERELCCLCHQPIPVLFVDGQQTVLDSRNAAPIDDGRCCPRCDVEIVIPERLRSLTEGPTKKVQVIQHAMVQVYRDCLIEVPERWSEEQIFNRAKQVMDRDEIPFEINPDFPIQNIEEHHVHDLQGEIIDWTDTADTEFAGLVQEDERKHDWQGEGFRNEYQRTDRR